MHIHCNTDCAIFINTDQTTCLKVSETVLVVGPNLQVYNQPLELSSEIDEDVNQLTQTAISG